MPKKAKRVVDDPIELAVFSNLVAAIAEEACGTIERTAFTAFLKESNDFCVALAKPDGTFFAYPRKSGVTTFLGLPLDEVVGGVAEWKEGDVLFTNDPYSTAGLVTHSPDVNLIAPIFVDGELVAFAWGFLHSSDVGGSTPGSIAPSNQEVYQEGLRIPPTKLYSAAEVNQDLLRIISANVRAPAQLWGDLRALMSAFHVASGRLQELFKKYGTSRAKALVDQCLDYSDAKTRAVIAKMRTGTFRFEDYLDDDVGSPFPVRICVALTVEAGEIHLDFTGTDPQVLAAFNLATSGRRSHAWLTIGVVHYLLTEDPDIPLNGGILRSVRVTAPAGTIVHAVAPAPLGGRIVSGIRVMEVTFGALGQAAPDHLPAAGSGQGMLPVISVPSFGSGGRKVNVLQPLIGGSGGRPHADGYDGTDYSFGFLKNTPIEIVESDMDVVVHRYYYVADSAGAGRFRGGLGVGFVFQTTLPDTTISMRGMERTRFEPWGAHGGQCGRRTAPAIVNPGSKQERRVRKVDVLTLRANDLVQFESSGGGGYGSPLDRDPEAVASDVRFGYVTKSAAQRVYGVALKGRSANVDDAGTAALRKQMRRTAEKRAGFSFGPERLAYERIWNKRAYAEMQKIYATLPLHARTYAKTAIMNQLRARPKSTQLQPISPAEVRSAWNVARRTLGMD